MRLRKCTIQRYLMLALALFSSLGLWQAAEAQTPGSFDSAFNTTGKLASAPFSNTIGSSAAAILVQTDGKILVAGSCVVAGGDSFCLYRFNSDGTLDASFDGPDVAGTGVGSGNGKFKFRISSGTASAFALAQQSDGNIVVAGKCADDDTPGFLSLCLVRLLPNGAFDSSFSGASGGAGRFVMSMFAGHDGATALAIDSANQIVVSGPCMNTANNWDFCVARFHGATGALDTNFGGGAGWVSVGIGSSHDNARALAIQSDGKIVVAGDCTLVAAPSNVVQFCAIRLLANGVLDPTFNGPSGVGAGKVMFGFTTAATAGHAYSTALTLQSDGGIVLGGYCQDTAVAAPYPWRFCVARLVATNGAYDVNFDGSTNGNGRLLVDVRGEDDRLYSLKVDASGRLLLAGDCKVSTQTQFCVARLLSSGTLDSGYSGPAGASPGNGRFSFSMLGTVDALRAATIDVTGRFLVAGGCYNAANAPTAQYDLCLARLHGGAATVNPSLNCGLDLDGNGLALPGSDGVLLLRWLSGFRDAALTNGALGAGATRDATAIHAHATAYASRWNVDANANPPRAQTDGLLLLRSLLGLRDGALAAGAIDTNGVRGSAALVQLYLDAGCPVTP